ncbi:MAG: 3-phosphoglycerate dehydrogenase family protein [Clostridia bacterium]|nr:3-phosphoglycerate dehydrogenase family protein [Clostridia bacterium]
MKNILTLNSISPVINDIFDSTYNVSSDVQSPVGIMLRSFKMQGYALDKETVAIARAGAGVNNIPIEDYAKEGVVVFNTPGANANAVKELVIASLLLGSRKIAESMKWVETLKGQGEEVAKLVEKGKSQFVGGEIQGKKLGIIGLGAIGAQVANAALGLGMEVYGYDPFLSVNAALKLSRHVNVVKELDDIIKNCDYITIHIPYIANQNKGFINAGLIRKMKDGVVIINCARGELVDNADMLKATESGKVGRYVVDFPADELIGAKNVVCFPHLGASTPEAEDNCAVMAAKQLIDYIENGNIVNSVNYPTCTMPKTTANRIVILHKNVANILAQITSPVGNEQINIANLSNQSKGDYAVTMIDTDGNLPETAISHISNLENIIRVRVIK